jgi:NAD(P)-dependent dehydrogenase (short-subunit alcohol dehydrogenase family)
VVFPFQSPPPVILEFISQENPILGAEGMELNQKIALVTGSAHRVGKHIALRLAQEGCHIIIHYNHSKDRALETLHEVKNLEVKAVALQANLSCHEEIIHLFEQIDQEFQGLDILINSAAILKQKGFLEVELSDWNQTMALNLTGAFFCLQQAAIRMLEKGGGAVINISDVIGLRPWAKYPVHSISKAGVEMLTKVAAIDLAPEIRVNAVAPGLVLAPKKMSSTRWEQLAQDSLLQRTGTPEDVASAVVFLLKSDYITGETLVVDGGMQIT